MTLNVEKAKKLSTALAQLIGNPLQLLASLTLPLVSYFSGSRFNDILLVSSFLPCGTLPG